jgi:hypothetical protein
LSNDRPVPVLKFDQHTILTLSCPLLSVTCNLHALEKLNYGIEKQRQFHFNIKKAAQRETG